jgi:hypothetical protein
LPSRRPSLMLPRAAASFIQVCVLCAFRAHHGAGRELILPVMAWSCRWANSGLQQYRLPCVASSSLRAEREHYLTQGGLGQIVFKFAGCHRKSNSPTLCKRRRKPAMSAGKRPFTGGLHTVGDRRLSKVHRRFSFYVSRGLPSRAGLYSDYTASRRRVKR